ncbi:MAG: M20 family metallopeptidase, partial [Clostridia bacterium]|nr:M20 family metallopeptidase [Clostridia bacterium]
MDKHSFMPEYLDAVSLNAVRHRRFIHSRPELSFNEYGTAAYVCRVLDDLNIPYVNNIAGTGICAVIYGEANASADEPKALLLRADMDALPITEVSDKEYKSQNKGKMHACGHDAHTAILLGICEILNASRDKFSGCTKLVFQPGEETSGGAKPMIDSGILENPKVDACIALHVDPEIDTGKLRIKSGSLYASPDDFKITVRGRGGHGAEPEKCVDPIMVSADIIHALMNLVSREIDPFDNAVITVGSIHGGTASNIIPDIVEMKGTARSLTNDVRKYLKRRIGEVARGVCAAYNAECDYEFTELFPPL